MVMLTEEQAYDAMVDFLEQHWERNGRPEELGALLGSMSKDVWADGSVADPAMWDDWRQAVRRATSD